ncbi:MAG: Hpt domain-containing protein [Candidatus Limnocylindria bacterium]
MNQPDARMLEPTVLAELKASVDGDRAFVVELIEAYLADGVAHVDAIAAALSDGDAEAMVRPAHTLKSSSATVGAMHLSSTARELEMAARSGSLVPAGEAAAGRIPVEWDATTVALRSWIAADDAP